MSSTISLSCFRTLTIIANAKYIRNNVTSTRGQPFLFYSQGYLNMWLTFGIRIIFWIFTQSLYITYDEGGQLYRNWLTHFEYYVFFHANFSTPNVFAHLCKVIVNLLYGHFRFLARKNLIENISAR